MKQLSSPRTAAKLRRTLDERLNRYSLAASVAGVSVLALATPAQARIVFTPAHIRLTPNHKLAIDLNHDGIKDFELIDAGAGSSDFLEVNALQSGNALAQADTDCNPSVGVAALDPGVLIGKGQVFSHNLYCMAQKLATEGSFGSWPGVTNRFVGVKFVIKGKSHFGWVRLSVSRAPFIAHITGYAYETVPNKPIVAGKTSGAEAEVSEEQTGTLGKLATGSPAPPGLGRRMPGRGLR